MKMQRLFVLLSLVTIFSLMVACTGAAPQPAAEAPADARQGEAGERKKEA